MFTQAATRFSISASASRSAAARSGRFVSTSKLRMFEPFLNRRMTQANSQRALQASVVQAPRVVHEGQQFRRYAPGRLGARDARRARQAGAVGDQIEPGTHLELGVVRRVVG